MNNCVTPISRLAALVLAAAGSLSAQTNIIAIRGGEIHTISHGIVQNGVVLILDGKIIQVGSNVTIPPGARVIDADGLIVTPGVIDSRSSFGYNRGTAVRPTLMAPTRRVSDAFQQPSSSNWLQGGVTAAYLAPSPTSLIGGFGAVVQLGEFGPAAIIDDAAAMHASFGEAVLNRFDTRTTRQGLLGVLRQEFIRTREYMENPPAVADPDREALSRVLRREIPLRVTAHTPDDIMTGVRLGEEFDLRLIIDSGTGAHQVAGRLARARVPVIVGASILALGGGGPFEGFAHTEENAARLHRAGVNISLSTDAPGGRSVVLEALIAKAHGLPEDAALKAITLDAAAILGVSDRLGSIEPGKDADIVLWRGHPLTTWGETRLVMVNGRTVFERGIIQ